MTDKEREDSCVELCDSWCEQAELPTYTELQSQLAAANERADGLQRIVDEARAQKPVCITTLDDFCTVVAYPPPNVLHSVPLYAAAPVPAQPSALTERWTQAQLDQLNSKASDLFKAATHKPLAEDVPAQPAVVPTYEIVMSSGRKARLTATELVDRLATCRDEIERLRGERRVQPAVVPKHAADRIHEMRDVLFDIATSDVMGDRPEHSFVTVAINRDTLSRAAILSTTDTEVKR